MFEKSLFQVVTGMTAQNKTNLRPALLLASRRSSRELRNQRTTADLGSGCWVVGALRRWGAEKMGLLPRTCDKKHLDKSREDSRVRAECGRDSLPTGQRGLLGWGVGLPYGRVRAGSLSDPPFLPPQLQENSWRPTPRLCRWRIPELQGTDDSQRPEESTLSP